MQKQTHTFTQTNSGSREKKALTEKKKQVETVKGWKNNNKKVAAKLSQSAAAVVAN